MNRPRPVPRVSTVHCLVLVTALSACATDSPELEVERGTAPLIEAAERASEAGDWAVAIESYAAALERTPWNTRLVPLLVHAHVERASQLRSENRGPRGLEAAEAELRRAWELAPDDADIERSLGVILAERAAYASSDAEAAALRAAATRHAPEVVADLQPRRLGIERRLDLAIEEIERGQLDAGLDRLERMHVEHGDRVDVARLLAQARVRKGIVLSDRRNWDAAAEKLAGAVEIYAGLGHCVDDRCKRSELETAHHNYIVNWLQADRYDEAQAALAHARSLGLRFPTLADAVAKGANW